MLRVFTLLAVAGVCLATNIKWPKTGEDPCIMMDITVKNMLVWTNSSGKDTNLPWNFTDSTTLEGNCKDRTVTQIWSNSDNGTFSFAFSDDGNQVSVDMTLNFVPDNVWKNGDKKAVIMDLKTIKLGDDDKAFLCHSFTDMKSNKNGTAGNSYTMTFSIEMFHVQAYNLTNGTYGEAYVCDADRTTTPQPDTTTVPSNHTTEPSNHTTPMPTPKPSGNHPTQDINLYNKFKNVSCINIKGQFLFTLPYPKKDKTNGTVTVGMDKINEATGSCNDTALMNTVMVRFYDNWWMNLTIKREAKSNLGASAETKYWWHELDLTYPLDDTTFPDYDPAVASEMNVKKIFSDDFNEATVEGSYLCNSNIKTDLGDGAQLETWDLQYNAFQNANTTSFSEANVSECKDDAKTNSIVPIAVGAALAGLVVIVLIAYLIGRRRNRKGYESV